MSSAPSLRRSSVVGAAAIALYLGAALLSSKSLLIRPLYQGTPTLPPYQWVNPPPDLKATNRAPDSASGVIAFGKDGSEPFTLTTPDGQATVIVPLGAITPAAGETEVTLSIKPLDPATVGAPPAGLRYDGNGYDVAFTYEGSGLEAPLQAKDCPLPTSPQVSLCISVAMRYPISASAMYGRQGDAWVKLRVEAAPFQLFADSPASGVFVSVGAPSATPKQPSKIGDVIAIGAGVLATVLAVVAARVLPTRRRRSVPQKGKGKAQPKKKR